MEVEAILLTQLRLFERAFHCGNVFIAERHGLEVGEAPPDFAQLRCDCDGTAIGIHAVRLPPDRLEHMAIGHPHLGLVGVPRQHLPVKRHRFIIFADPSHRGGLEIGVPGIFWINRQQRIEFGDGVGNLVLAVKHSCKVRTRRKKVGRNFDRAAQQGFSIGQPANPARQFRQHADRCHVERVGLQMHAEQRLGFVQPVIVERERSLQQLRIAQLARKIGRDHPCRSHQERSA